LHLMIFDTTECSSGWLHAATVYGLNRRYNPQGRKGGQNEAGRHEEKGRANRKTSHTHMHTPQVLPVAC
jgi:hypothetical protein